MRCAGAQAQGESQCGQQLAMIVLLRSYLGVSDAEAMELTVVDLRWQMVRRPDLLQALGSAERQALHQGSLQDQHARPDDDLPGGAGGAQQPNTSESAGDLAV